MSNATRNLITTLIRICSLYLLYLILNRYHVMPENILTGIYGLCVMVVLLIQIRNGRTVYEYPIVHQNTDGLWYFWDESWQYEHGQYKTKRECERALDKYAKHC